VAGTGVYNRRMSDGKTGIEVTVEVNDEHKTEGKIFHFLHLDWLANSGAKNATFVLEVDGEKHEQPFKPPHVVECAPGEHKLRVWFYDMGAIAKAMDPTFTRAELHVTVKPGALTQVLYHVPGALSGPTMKLV
jgi:hypothetical protein